MLPNGDFTKPTQDIGFYSKNSLNSVFYAILALILTRDAKTIQIYDKMSRLFKSSVHQPLHLN
jgi:hypothetical protein